MKRLLRAAAGAAALFTVTAGHAAVIVDTLGNEGAFTDGQILTIGDLLGLPAAPPPFDTGYGSDPASNFDVTWTHNYGPIVDPIVSASIEIGLYDHEGGSVGTATDGSGDTVTLADEQLNVFDIDGTSLRSALLPDFEAGGQAENAQYEEYVVTLPGSTFADLADGNAIVDLSLMGPVFSPAGLPFLPDIVNQYNGAWIIYSKLTIETRDPGGVPEPASLALLAVGLLLVGGYARYRRRRRPR